MNIYSIIVVFVVTCYASCYNLSENTE